MISPRLLSRWEPVEDRWRRRIRKAARDTYIRTTIVLASGQGRVVRAFQFVLAVSVMYLAWLVGSSEAVEGTKLGESRAHAGEIILLAFGVTFTLLQEQHERAVSLKPWLRPDGTAAIDWASLSDLWRSRRLALRSVIGGTTWSRAEALCGPEALDLDRLPAPVVLRTRSDSLRDIRKDMLSDAAGSHQSTATRRIISEVGQAIDSYLRSIAFDSASQIDSSFTTTRRMLIMIAGFLSVLIYYPDIFLTENPIFGPRDWPNSWFVHLRNVCWGWPDWVLGFLYVFIYVLALSVCASFTWSQRKTVRRLARLAPEAPPAPAHAAGAHHG